MKVRYPKNKIVERIGSNIEMELLHDFDRFSNGSMLMTITEVKISQGEKEVGKIRFEMSGAAIQALIGSRSWMISTKELWPIFAEADELYMEKK